MAVIGGSVNRLTGRPRLSVFGASGAAVVLTLDNDADLAFAYGGQTLISGYTGPLATACATGAPDTPSTTVQIFAGADGKANETAAIAAFGTTYHIWKWHDQKALAGDLVASSANARMSRINTFPAFPFNSFNEFEKNYVATTPSYERTTFSLFEVMAGSMAGSNPETTSQLGASWDAGFSPLSEELGRGVLTQGIGFARGFLYMGVRPSVCSSVLTPSGVKIRVDDQRQTISGSIPALSATGTTLGRGWQPASGKQHVAMVGYKRSLSDADELAIATRLAAIFAIPARTAAYILADGDSIQRGQGSTDNVTKWAYIQNALPANVHLINAGRPGASQQARDPAFFTDRRIAGRKQVWMQNWGSNDLDIGGVATTMFGADNTTGTRYNIANAKAAGWSVVIETVIRRASFDTAKETQRQAFNTLIRNNAASLGYTVIDYGDTVYANSDGTHPTSAGYQAMSVIAIPVLQAAIA